MASKFMSQEERASCFMKTSFTKSLSSFSLDPSQQMTAQKQF